jgi:GT2 family glycosyltransferase
MSEQTLRAVLDRLTVDGNDRIVAIIVTWNSNGHVHRCLDSIGKSTVPVATLVIDNQSTDDTASSVEARQDPAIIVVHSGANLGYAGGNNLGLSLAARAGAAFVVIVNPDATIEPECFNRLVELLRSDETIGLASPAICYASSDRLWYGGSDVDRTTGTAYHLREGMPLASLPKQPYDTGRASGCMLALVPERIKSVGLFDERYFLYYEEAEWSLRIHEHGLRIVVAPAAVAWHDVGHGTGGANPTYHYYMTRNRLLLASQHCDHGAIGALPRSLRDTLITLITLARQHRSALVSCGSAIFVGYIDFARRRLGQRATCGAGLCRKGKPAIALSRGHGAGDSAPHPPAGY